MRLKMNGVQRLTRTRFCNAAKTISNLKVDPSIRWDFDKTGSKALCSCHDFPAIAREFLISHGGIRKPNSGPTRQYGFIYIKVSTKISLREIVKIPERAVVVRGNS